MQAKGVLNSGRAQYMLILIFGKLFGFLNICAPNSVTGRILLWNMLMQDLPVALLPSSPKVTPSISNRNQIKEFGAGSPKRIYNTW